MSSPPPKNILIHGATGVIGKHITVALAEALQAGTFSRVAIFTSQKTVDTKASELDKFRAAGVEVIVGDIENEEQVLEAYKDFDTIISALGRRVIDRQTTLLQLAERSPTTHHFYPSEYGTDIAYHAQSAHEKPHQAKLRVRRFISTHIHRLRITYLVTGPFADLYLGPPIPGHEAAGGWDVKARKAHLLGTGEERISLTTMHDVGRLLLASLQHPPPNRDRILTLKVNSYTTTPHAITAEYERQTGGGAWAKEYTSLDTLRRLEAEQWERGSPVATLYTLRRIWTEGGTLYEGRDNGRVGFEGREEGLEEGVRGWVERAGKAE